MTWEERLAQMGCVIEGDRAIRVTPPGGKVTLNLPRVSGTCTPTTRPDLQPTPAPYRSKTEARYADLLKLRQACGEIERWWYEGLKLRLAKETFYTADFLVHIAGKTRLELHEVKGFWREDARIKIKVAAAHYPCFAFVACQYKHGSWSYEYF